MQESQATLSIDELALRFQEGEIDQSTFERLLSDKLEKNVEKNQIEAQKKRDSMPPELIKELRRRAKTDLFFLAYSILGYNRLSENLHGELCAWLEANKDEKYIEVLLPRAHFKSTIVTISKVIQLILTDDVGDQPYPANLGPDARILICHEVASMAQGYLYSIVQHFTSNPMLMALFPELVPTPKKQRINSRELVLPRSKIWNEPTVGTMGVGGRSQGLHYDMIIFDDLFGEEATQSETVAERTRKWFNSISGFFVKLAVGKFIVVGTRWGPEDIYAHIEKNYLEVGLKIYRRSIEEDVLDHKGEKIGTRVIFPEEMTPEHLIVLKKDPLVFSAQYMNDPEGGMTRFKPEWIRRFEWQGNNRLIIPDAKPYESKTVSLSECNIHMLVDPATTGLLGWLIVATDHHERHFILEAVQEAIESPKLMQKFFEKYNQYRFRSLIIEKVLFSALYEPWINTEFRLRNQYFNITMLDTQQKSKEARVLGLANDFSAGKFYLNDKLYSKEQDKQGRYSDLEYQIRKFGSIKDYHILDALAQLPRIPTKPPDPTILGRIREREMLALRERSHTGYSAIKFKRT